LISSDLYNIKITVEFDEVNETKNDCDEVSGQQQDLEQHQKAFVCRENLKISKEVRCRIDCDKHCLLEARMLIKKSKKYTQL